MRALLCAGVGRLGASFHIFPENIDMGCRRSCLKRRTSILLCAPSFNISLCAQSFCMIDGRNRSDVGPHSSAFLTTQQHMQNKLLSLFKKTVILKLKSYLNLLKFSKIFHFLLFSLPEYIAAILLTSGTCVYLHKSSNLPP